MSQFELRHYQKLKKRAERILAQLSGSTQSDVRDALGRALLLRGCDLNSAKQLLARGGGRLRAALKHSNDAD